MEELKVAQFIPKDAQKVAKPNFSDILQNSSLSHQIFGLRLQDILSARPFTNDPIWSYSGQSDKARTSVNYDITRLATGQNSRFYF